MREFLKRFFTKQVAILLMLSVALGLFFVPATTYSHLIAKLILSQVDQSQVHIALREPGLRFVGLSAKELVLRPKSAPFGIVIKDASVRLVFSQLFQGRLALQLNGNWLGGKISVVSHPLSELLSAELEELHLHLHPVLQGLRVESAILDLTIKELELNGKGEFQNLDLHLAKIYKRVVTTLPKSLTKTPFPIEIPPLKNASLKFVAGSSEADLMIDEVRFHSQLGQISGAGSVKKGSKPSLKLSLNGLLKKSGFKLYGQTLKLFSNSRVKHANQPFQIDVDGPFAPVPTIKITPIETQKG